MQKYISVTEFSKLHNLDPGQIRKLLASDRIPGATKIGNQWAIPADAEKPTDARVKSGKYKNWRKNI